MRLARVARRVVQAGCGGHARAPAVGFDGAAFEHERDRVDLEAHRPADFRGGLRVEFARAVRVGIQKSLEKLRFAHRIR